MTKKLKYISGINADVIDKINELSDSLTYIKKQIKVLEKRVN